MANIAVTEPTEVLETFKNAKMANLEILSKSRELADDIRSDDTWNDAGNFRVQLNKWKKESVNKLESIRKPQYEAYQKTLALIKEVIQPFDDAMIILDTALSTFKNERDRRRRIEEEKRIAEAKVMQEEALLKAAEEAQKSGDHQRANAILEMPVIPVTPPMLKETKVEGLQFRENWKVDELIDIKLLVEAVRDGIVPLQAVEPNMKFLNQQARSLKSEMKYPGVRVMKETITASRTKE